MASIPSTSIHILLITSSPDHEAAVRAELENGGLQASIQWVDSEAFVSTSLTPVPDLILFDCSLPFELSRASSILKGHAHKAPFILISDTNEASLAGLALELGADDYVTKPQLKRLTFIVSQILEQKRPRESERLSPGKFHQASVPAQAEENLRSQNEFLALLNEMTRDFLLSNDYDSGMRAIAFSMTKIINADDCYILAWDEETKEPTAIATTAKLDFEFSEATVYPEGIGIAASILQVGHVIAIDDVLNSPYIKSEVIQRFPVKSAIGIPLIARDQRLGVAFIAFRSPHTFTHQELERADQAGNQVALALWTFQQSLEIQQRLTESQTLSKIERALSETERIGTGEILQLIVDSARQLMPHAEKSVIHLVDMEEQVLVAQAVSGPYEQDSEPKRVKMRLGEGVAGRVIREGITINIGDISTNPLFLPSESPPAFLSLMVAPVQSGNRPIGTISVQSSTSHAFSRKDADLLNALAIQSAIAIENTRLFETTQQRLREVNTLYQIIRQLVVSLDADQLIKDAISLLQESFAYYHVQVFLIDPEAGGLVARHGSGALGNELMKQGYRASDNEGIVGHVAKTAEPFMTNDVDRVLFFKRTPLLPQTQFEMTVPIRMDDRVIGVLDIQQTPDHSRFTESDLQLVTAIADHLAIVLQKAALYSNLQTALQHEKEIRSQLVQSERLALVGRLLASVSHELNNPLQAIQNALFLLKDETHLSAQASQDLDVILSEAERMAALIERLRTAYRPVRTNDFQSLELNELIENVHTLITTHMRHKEIAFEFFPDRDLPPIAGLPDQMRQVILNLFLNAIEMMKPGGCLTVATQWMRTEDEVLLVVKDTGPGIEAAILPFIFDPFMTTKQTGTGLGLTITHDIIQQHHGRIEAGNDPEGGAIFRVWLPVHTGAQA